MDPDFLLNESISSSQIFSFDDSESFLGLFTPSIPSKKDEVLDSISANGNSTNDSISEIATTKLPLPKKIDKKKYSFPCPLCSESVQPYNVKREEIIFMCSNKQCIFPYNMKNQMQEFKAKEDKLKKVFNQLKSKYKAYHDSREDEVEKEYFDPIKKLKI